MPNGKHGDNPLSDTKMILQSINARLFIDLPGLCRSHQRVRENFGFGDAIFGIAEKFAQNRHYRETSENTA